MHERMNWDDLRYFLAVARQGQFLNAAARMGVSQARLSRHIAALEDVLGTRLFDRTPKGSPLTTEGEALLSVAERVEAEVLAGLGDIQGEEAVAGTVRIGVPDGFGSGYLAPRLGQFREILPKLRIQLVPITRNFSLSEREADLAVMVGRPAKGRLRVRKLTDYTLSLYAAQEYLARTGQPARPQDLAGHTLIGYVDDLIYSAELDYAGEFLRGWTSDIEIASALGQLQAVRAGVGVGVCHDFLAAGDPTLCRLLPDLQSTRSYWLVWHENMRVAPRLHAAADLLVQMVQADRALFHAEPK